MIKIEYPPYNYKIENRSGRESIFDVVRKIWVSLTPEEWVRQNFLQYLLQIKRYPAALMAVEKEISLGDLRKRCDIVIYDRKGKPLVIIECKAMEVELGATVLDQILRYNISLPSKYLIITNGVYCFAFERWDTGFRAITEVPSWNIAGQNPGMD
ncbi:MAG: type I restriction enzyme HsdR N-terminal domain-containing protein [Bacteroidetes bacterium]|nr:type I restriction enzyme HsdR N-terminal domain-containing protein [Bacteroidota bacterium]